MLWLWNIFRTFGIFYDYSVHFVLIWYIFRFWCTKKNLATLNVTNPESGLQVILNKDTPLACEPTLLPAPNHVMVNHMYALSIKVRQDLGL
jgi:hypothetical protein